MYEALYPIVTAINGELMSALSNHEAGVLDAALDRLQARAEAMAARPELPKADRRRKRALPEPQSRD